MEAPAMLDSDTETKTGTESLEQQFRHLGWCPGQVDRLQQTCSSAAFGYLSTLDRRDFRPNNYDRFMDYPSCAANNFEKNNCKEKHTPACPGSYSLIAVDAAHVAAIIRDGQVPLVSIHHGPASPSGETTVELRATPRTTSTWYTRRPTHHHRQFAIL
jgi:hypothetical protein